MGFGAQARRIRTDLGQQRANKRKNCIGALGRSGYLGLQLTYAQPQSCGLQMPLAQRRNAMSTQAQESEKLKCSFDDRGHDRYESLTEMTEHCKKGLARHHYGPG